MEIALLLAVLIILLIMYGNLSGVKSDLNRLREELREFKKVIDFKRPDEPQKATEKVPVPVDFDSFKPRVPVKEEIKKEQLPEVIVGEPRQEKLKSPKPADPVIVQNEIH